MGKTAHEAAHNAKPGNDLSRSQECSWVEKSTRSSDQALEKSRPAANPRLDKALYKRICTKSKQGLQIDWALTRRYEKELQDEGNQTVPPAAHI